jgi:hypothetical protein
MSSCDEVLKNYFIDSEDGSPVWSYAFKQPNFWTWIPAEVRFLTAVDFKDGEVVVQHVISRPGHPFHKRQPFNTELPRSLDGSHFAVVTKNLERVTSDTKAWELCYAVVNKDKTINNMSKVNAYGFSFEPHLSFDHVGIPPSLLVGH